MTNMGEAGSKTLKNFRHKPEARIRSSITGTVRLTVKATNRFQAYPYFILSLKPTVTTYRKQVTRISRLPPTSAYLPTT